MTKCIFELITHIVQITPDVASSVTDPLIKGIKLYLNQNPNSTTFKGERLQLIFLIISIGSSQPSSMRHAFDCALSIITSHPESAVTSENFGECVDMMISFIIAGSSTSLSSSLQPSLSPKRDNRVSKLYMNFILYS